MQVNLFLAVLKVKFAKAQTIFMAKQVRRGEGVCMGLEARKCERGMAACVCVICVCRVFVCALCRARRAGVFPVVDVSSSHQSLDNRKQ